MATLHLDPVQRTRQQLAQELKVSTSTLGRRLKAQGFISTGKLLTPTDQREIALLFGYTIVWPDDSDRNDVANRLFGIQRAGH